jgi:hypothetical protein
MIRLIFIVISELSSGELTIAYEFANRLSKDKYEIHFLIPEKNRFFFDNTGIKTFTLSIWGNPETNLRLFSEFVDQVKPDFFIASDVYTMEYAWKWSGLDFTKLREFGIPIVSIDEYEYHNSGYNVDYYGGIIKISPPIIDQCDFLICNCPLNVRRSSRENIKYFSLYGQRLTQDESQKEVIRKRLNIGPGEKIIFIANSKWETLNVYRLPALGMFLKWVPILLQNYLYTLNSKITIIHVGPNPWPEVQSDLIHYNYFNNLPPVDFDSYLLTANLFITLNMVSVTLSKAIFGTVPSIVLQNHKIINFQQLESRVSQMPDWYQTMAEEIKMAYPFRAGIFGFYQFLKPILKDNEYVDTFIEVPLFKMSEVISTLQKYLFDEPAINELKVRQLAYVDNILKLPTPDDIMQELTISRDLKGK